VGEFVDGPKKAAETGQGSVLLSKKKSWMKN